MSKISPFVIVDAQQTINAVLVQGAGVECALRRLGFPDCTKCSVRFDETLEEAVMNYGLDLEKVLMVLNAILIKQRRNRSKQKDGGQS